MALYRESPDADSEALVFVGPKGGVLRRRFVERILRPTAESVRAEAIAAGRAHPVPAGLTFHALRHVAVTAMADAGVPYKVTQRRAGHSTARMTMEHYSHRSTEADKAAAAALQSYFADAPTENRWYSFSRIDRPRTGVRRHPGEDQQSVRFAHQSRAAKPGSSDLIQIDPSKLEDPNPEMAVTS